MLVVAGAELDQGNRERQSDSGHAGPSSAVRHDPQNQATGSGTQMVERQLDTLVRTFGQAFPRPTEGQRMLIGTTTKPPV